MFDIGFSELIVIGVVALVVIGPERLPKVARTVGVLVGRLQRYVAQVKADINREMEAAELGKVKQEFESAARSFQTEVESKAAEVEREIRDAQAQVDRELASAAAGTSAAASAPPVEAPAAAPPSPQLELGIEEPPQPAAAPRDKPAA
ncbi:MAG TPA: Sec-independent protein translocase protein TatB [Usitatibacter sp.]|nr:Sec-independent protein translocase protein TatB [Usitatibacter sp.]